VTESLYPDAIDNPPTNLVDGADAGDETPGSTNVGPHADHHNLLAKMARNIELTLGENPEGAFADVAERLAAGLLTGTAADYTVSGHTTDRALALSAWTITNDVVNRTLNADSFEFDDLADFVATLARLVIELSNVVATMIADDIARGARA
jgi:hypothetical protein